MSVQMSPTVMVACDDLILLDEVIRHLEEIPQWRLVVSARTVGDLVQGCVTHQPDAVLLAASLAEELAEDPAAGQLDVILVVFGRAAETGELKAALRLGASGYVQWPEEKGDLRLLVEQGMHLPDAVERPQGPLHAVWAPKGGAGASVVAAHLAAAFAQQGKDCLLADLDLDNGDQRSVLNVQSEVRTIGDLLPVAHELTDAVVRSMVWNHPAGFGAVLSPAAQGESAAASANDLGRVLGVIRQVADYVVADVPSGTGDLALATLRTATSVTVVLTPDLLSLRRARRAFDVLQSIGLSPERVRVVLNQYGGPHVSTREVEQVLGVKVVVKVRAEFEIYKATNRGEIAPPAVKMLSGLAKRLVAVDRPHRPRIPRALLRRSGRRAAGSRSTPVAQAKVTTWTD